MCIRDRNKGEELAARPRIEYRQMYDEAGGALGYRYVVVLAPADTSASGKMQGEVRVARRQSGEVPSVPFTVSLQSKEQEGVEDVYKRQAFGRVLLGQIDVFAAADLVAHDGAVFGQLE